MADDNNIYQCGICGKVVSVIEESEGTLVCCGKGMEKLEEKTISEEGNEKHVPVVSIEDGRVAVKVGSAEHPMEEKHHIELIDIMADGRVIASARLYPRMKPEAEFCLKRTGGIKARALCNVHGLWRI